MPFQSAAQMRACFARHDPRWDCKLWMRHTPNKIKIQKMIEIQPKERKQFNILSTSKISNKIQK